ncbi:hypothetical protein UAW_02964 [Enterococcus haemoperoxidus ATCC BAA-382]|uniref:Uncharacterized protein n=1 Tax=Enterococcus haemoperoxidus ATCC BAA-382 TaxID=1158608 RepID=R2QCH0_9ENTE|nr:hypothetical protein [Enterococcus haemoperoxidus]EOH92923.1 hypothetical protein UAW_02964 [Enterococcus haemoperoxidus ATCC BAA-382]EOT61666.1 hypothetical protein I583_00648 [Enterococcus haemoperoxidus ATCC BAA-382]OJG55501.1 hypothetical protein RV06_GL001944 [Enterococcus haemoperoxidus]
MKIADIIGKLSANSSGNNKIDPTKISVEKNVIALDDRTLQISNVSQIFVAEPDSKIPWLAALLFIVSVVWFSNHHFSGILGMIVTGFYIFLVIMSNLNKGYYMYVNLNSGFTYLIHCENKEFAEKAREVIESCINNVHRKEKVVINMKQENIQIDNRVVNVDQSINDSTVVSGDNNEVEK